MRVDEGCVIPGKEVGEPWHADGDHYSYEDVFTRYFHVNDEQLTYLPDKGWDINKLFSVSLHFILLVTISSKSFSFGTLMAEKLKRTERSCTRLFLAYMLLPSSWVNDDLLYPPEISYDQSKHSDMKESCDINRYKVSHTE